MMKKNGFTILELMVVISIICVLAALLFGGAVGAGEGRKKKAALLTVKNLHVAFESYKLTYGYYPSGTTLKYTGSGSGLLDCLETKADFAFDHDDLDSSNNLIDPWENAYQFLRTDSTPSDHTFKGVFFRSYGPDGVSGGDDDFYQKDGE